MCRSAVGTDVVNVHETLTEASTPMKTRKYNNKFYYYFICPLCFSLLSDWIYSHLDGNLYNYKTYYNLVKKKTT